MKKILENIIKTETDCWEWTRSLCTSGYGQLTENKKYWTTHRYVYTQIHGEIPDGMIVRHTCHNRKCCNPEHLLLGTDQDNWNDSETVHRNAAAKRRSSWSINGIEYATSREAVAQTGISMNSVIKYTINGVFDIDAYREACIIARVTPKI